MNDAARLRTVAFTYSTTNRAHFAVLEALYRRVGMNLTRQWDLTDERQLAAALVHEGGAALLRSGLTAGTAEGTKDSTRREKAAWKQVNPDDGVGASIYLTLALAATLSGDFEEDVDQAPVEAARLT